MNITEQNMIVQLQARNPSALEYIINLYTKSIYNLVYNILKDITGQEDIEECVSDVFVTAWEKSHNFSPEKGSQKTWLLILAKYKALDYRKLIYRQRKVDKDESLEKLVSKNGVENEVIAKEEIRLVIAFVDSLGELDQQIFYKRYFFYESIEIIAQNFGLTRKAVDTRLWRIRKLLKAKYGGI